MDPILGQIILWPGTYVPEGWALCDGRALSIQQYQALFAILGTKYGGDGRTTFCLPNLVNRVVNGTQNLADATPGGNATVNATCTGNGNVVIGANNLPAHNHPATFAPGTAQTLSIAIPAVAATPGTTDTPSNQTCLSKGVTMKNGLLAGNAQVYNTAASDVTLKPFDVPLPAASGNVTVNNNTGGGQPLPIAVSVPVSISVMQPYLPMAYIIALEGIFPPRP